MYIWKVYVKSSHAGSEDSKVRLASLFAYDDIMTREVMRSYSLEEDSERRDVCTVVQ